MILFPDMEEMAAIDNYTINETGIPQMVLMEKAALSVAAEIKKLISVEEKCLVVAAGGNNGGDAVAVARILTEEGYTADVVFLNELKKRTEAFDKQLEIAKNCDVNIFDLDYLRRIKNTDHYKLVLDGIFGVGLKRNIEGNLRDAVLMMNEMSGIKIALDIPSGISANDGKEMGVSFKADKTVTFGFKKLGMLYEPARTVCGEIIIKDIGFSKKAVAVVNPKHFTYSHDEILRILPTRKSDSNKGNYGKVAVIGGAYNMCGAVRFAAEGAIRAGAGLVRVFTDERNREIIQESLPEAMLATYDKKSFYYEDLGKEALKNVLGWADTIVIGPGLGTDREAEKQVEMLFEYAKMDARIVIDADALNIISKKREYLMLDRSIVITPHPMEMARLIIGDADILKSAGEDMTDLKDVLNYVKNNMENVAKLVAKKYNIIVVLKDARTVISDGDDRVYINCTGNSGMSKGGSGDALAGIIAGFAAQNKRLYEAAVAGVHIHGYAGDIARDSGSEYTMVTRDLLYNIAAAMGKIR